MSLKELFGGEEKKMKYVLENGFRRLQAFKKLGYNRIPAIVDNNRVIIDANIDDIEVVDNTRLTEDDNMTELMLSIKSVGLLQPIKLTSEVTSEKEFLVKNLVENLQRRDLTPLELAMGIEKLKKQGLNNSEISVRLGRSRSQIENVQTMLGNIPGHLKSEIGFNHNRKKSGKISVSVANYIMGRYIPDEYKTKLLTLAKSKELSSREIMMIITFVRQGMSVEEAIKAREDYETKELVIIVNRNEMERMKLIRRGSNDFSKFCKNVLKKKYPKLFY